LPRTVRFEKKEKRKEKIACGYVRVSSLQQKEEGYSLEQQTQSIKDFCRARGFRLNPDRIYRDEGRSGYKHIGRPGLRDVMRDVKDERIDVVVVYSISRFYRRTRELLKDLDTMKDHGVAFVSISENFDTSTPIGETILTILGALAQMESAQKSVQTRAGKTMRAQRIGFAGSARPRGYSFVRGINGNGKPEIIEPIYEIKPKDDPERVILEKVFRLYGRGEGMYKISMKTGLSLASICSLLSNPVYSGVLVWSPGDNAIVRRGEYEPYMSVSQYNANQRKRKSRNTNTRARNPLYTIHFRNGQPYLRQL